MLALILGYIYVGSYLRKTGHLKIKKRMGKQRGCVGVWGGQYVSDADMIDRERRRARKGGVVKKTDANCPHGKTPHRLPTFLMDSQKTRIHKLWG